MLSLLDFPIYIKSTKNFSSFGSGTFKFGSAEFLVVRRYVVALVVFLFTLKSSKNFNSFGKKIILFWI